MKQTHFLIALFMMSIQISGQGIAQWRGPARDGIYNETGLMKQWPAEGPQLLWHYDLLGPGHGSAAVTNDVVYTSGTEGDQGFIIALNNTGEVIWKKLYGEEWIESWPGVRSTPLIDHDRLYILSSFGKLYSLKTSDGSLIWTLDIMNDFNGRNIKWGYTENLAMEGDKLFITVGGEEANVVAVNKLNGKLIWKNKGKGEKSAYCSPTIILHNNRKIFVTQTESSILGFDAESGQMLWSHDQPNQYSVHPNTPLYYNGQLYVVSGYGKGGVMLQLSADGNSVTELWRDEKLDNRFGGVVLIDGRIWGAGDLNRKWECLDWKTGKELFNSSFIKKGNIISADNMLYCYGEDGTIALVEPSPTEGFKVISTFPVPYGSDQHWAHLVIHNKRLYVRHGESLMVYDISKQ